MLFVPSENEKLLKLRSPYVRVEFPKLVKYSAPPSSKIATNSDSLVIVAVYGFEELTKAPLSFQPANLYPSLAAAERVTVVPSKV